MKKVIQPVTETIKDGSQELTRTVKENTKQNNKALSNLNGKLLEIKNDRGVRGTIASYWLSPLSKIANHEHTSN